MSPIRIPGLALAFAVLACPRPALAADETPASSGPLPLRLVVLDVTGDDLPEKLYLGDDGARVELNLGDGRYEPVLQDLPGVRAHQVLATDLDADGLLDAYLVGPDANQAWLGLGLGRFREAGAELGLDDAGYGLSAERLDLDGDGLADLLLHNATGDVLFHAHAVAGRVTWSRDPETPEVDAGQRLGDGLIDLTLALLGGALEPARLPDDLEVQMNLDERGRPTLRMSGRPSEEPAEESASATAAALTGTKTTSTTAPLVATSADTKYVNDNVGEVDSADVVDGSLTGADISTASGDVGIGTTSPAAKLQVVGSSVGRVAISGGGYGGDAELRFTAGSGATSGMSWYFDTDVLAEQPVPVSSDSFKLLSTEDGGESYDRRYITVVRDSGEVSIGDAAPKADLHVYGSDTMGTVMISPSPDLGADNFSQVRLVEDPDGTYGMSLFYDGDSNQLKVWGTKDGNQTATGPHLTIERDLGRVGIQTKSPNASLGVKVIPGNISIIRGFDAADKTVFRIFDDGRAGFGTDSPNAALGVRQVPSTTTLFRAMNDVGETVASITNTGRVVCNALQIDGGGDLVEAFGSAAGVIEPGTVVCVDPEHPGRVLPSATAYDAKVVGAVSGANGVNHGIRMVQDGALDGDTLVAMTGRVYVRCTTEGGPIRAGDRLTTSSLCGHAMRAAADGPCDGAVLGKALSALDEGTGLVLVLVNLQ